MVYDLYIGNPYEKSRLIMAGENIILMPIDNIR